MLLYHSYDSPNALQDSLINNLYSSGLIINSPHQFILENCQREISFVTSKNLLFKQDEYNSQAERSSRRFIMWQNGTLWGRFGQIFSSTSLRPEESIINLVN
jgi:hypothetical protein